MKKLLTLIIIFFGYQAYAQVSVLNADSVRMGNPAGSGSVSISGKTYLKNITEGNSNDSILVRGTAGIVKFVKRSAFADAGIPFFSGDGGATTNGKLIYNTTLQKLRIYDAASSSWKDASPVDLSGYYTKVQSDTRYLNTASNGVIKTGNNFSLGGDLTSPAFITMNSGSAFVAAGATIGSGAIGILNIPGSGFSSYIGTTTGTGQIRSSLSFGEGGPDGEIILNDYHNKGIVYKDDYSAKFTARSLVDKAYVDAAVSGGGSFIKTSSITPQIADINIKGSIKNTIDIVGDNSAINFKNTNTAGSSNIILEAGSNPAFIYQTAESYEVGDNNTLRFWNYSGGSDAKIGFRVNSTGIGGDILSLHKNGDVFFGSTPPTASSSYQYLVRDSATGQLKQVNSGGSGSSYIFNNGISQASGIVGLGGNTNSSFPNNFMIKDIDGLAALVLSKDAKISSIGYGGNQAYGSETVTGITFADGSNFSNISLTSSKMKIIDNINHRGLEDDANYDGNKTANSYITKRYADSLFSAGGSFIKASSVTPQVANLDINGSIKTGAFYAGNTSLGFLGAPIGGNGAPNIAIGDHDTGINWYSDGDISLRGNGNDFIRFTPGNLLYLPKTPNTATTGYHSLVRDDVSGELMQIAGTGGVVGGAPDTTAYRTVANSFTKAQTNTQIANALGAFIPASQVQNNLSPASTILAPSITAVNTGLALKQDLLVSATNIKTVNGNSILGSGNLVESGNQTLDQVLTTGNTSTQTANVGTITASAKILGKTTSGTGDLQIGADASNGNFRVIQNGGSSMFGTYDSVNSKYYGFRNDLSSPIANFIGLGGWYQGVASVAGVTSSATDPIFGVVTTNQTGNTPGKGGTNFHVSADKHVETFNNILDNGSGVMQVASLTASQAVFTDGSKNLVSVAVTGTGNAVRAASPTLTGTPLAPTAAAGTNTTQIATTEFVQAAVTKVAINTQTANYTLTLADAGKFVQQNVSSANSVTVPPNSSVAFPIGTQILLRQMGTGQVTIAAGSGVTLQSADNALKSRVQFAPITLIKVATNTWAVMGDLTL